MDTTVIIGISIIGVAYGLTWSFVIKSNNIIKKINKIK